LREGAEIVRELEVEAGAKDVVIEYTPKDEGETDRVPFRWRLQ